jgi:hypothetical protein
MEVGWGLFLALMPPVFLATVVLSVPLFLLVEKPLSLRPAQRSVLSVR